MFYWNRFFLFLSIFFTFSSFGQGSLALQEKRRQALQQAEATLFQVQQKALHFEKVFQQITGRGSQGGLTGLSQDQILKLKVWSQNYVYEYNQLHEKLLDKEDALYRLDRQVSGDDSSKYLSGTFSQKRLQLIAQSGNNFTQQRVKLATFLENEMDQFNDQLSGTPGIVAKKVPSSTWKKLEALLTQKVAVPPAPTIPSPPKKVVQRPKKAAPKARRPSIKRKNKKISLDFTTPSSRKKAARLPASLPMKKKLPRKVAPILPMPSLSAEKPAPTCRKVSSQALQRFNDSSTNMKRILQKISYLNQLIFLSEKTPKQEDRRYYFYHDFLSEDFFGQKIEINKISVRNSEEKKRWKNLNYLARVRLAHLYEEAVKSSAQEIFKNSLKKRPTSHRLKKFFSPSNYEVAKIHLLGGSVCQTKKPLAQLRTKCAISVDVRFGQKELCHSSKKPKKQAFFTYYFRFEEASKKWVLYDALLPSFETKTQLYAKKGAFAKFRNQSFNKKETLSSLEAWLQKGLSTMDLLGFSEFLETQGKRGLASEPR